MIDQIGVVAGCPSVEPLLVSSSHRATALAMCVPSCGDRPNHEGKDFENGCNHQIFARIEFAISWRIRWNSEKIKSRSYSELRAPFDYKNSAPNTVETIAPV
jgi:hypothetical protein